MDQQGFVKQLLDFQKTTFDNSFTAMKVIQDQTEKVARSFIEQSAWVPEEGRKVLNQWVDAYRKGQEDFKNVMDDNFKKVEDYFGSLEKGKK